MSLLGTHEARDRRAGLGELLVGDGPAVRGGLGDAVAQVLLEQAERDRLQRLGRGGDLRQHVDAVLVALDHLADAADLALDAPHPLEVGVLVLGVAVHGRPPCVPDTHPGYRHPFYTPGGYRRKTPRARWPHGRPG